MMKDTSGTYSHDEAKQMQEIFESGEGFKVGEKILESGIYNCFHDFRIKHDYAFKAGHNLDKGENFPDCLFCKPIYRLSESKSYLD